ncbi:MAG TPA: sulfite exporter TauE/SafE family protein [Ktedonobacteraceae bacterium]|nr:sulfite exporter TauE/SafE family protein [Ktedonobacteraceae bacterium]
MSWLSLGLLFLAAIVGGTLNAVAGGGSFITFPSLIFSGVGAINANASSTVALWPGSLASLWAYRKELATQQRGFLVVLGVTSLIGGTLGALLLLNTPASTFVLLIPYLLLLATLLFAFSGQITKLLRRRNIEKTRISRRGLVGISLLQLIIAVYGGYFGAGIGILMLATLALMGMENIHEMNAVKTMLTILINGAAVIAFIIAGIIVWIPAIVMLAGAIIGGYGAAYFARKIDQKYVRGFVIVVGLTLTVYFFVHP